MGVKLRWVDLYAVFTPCILYSKGENIMNTTQKRTLTRSTVALLLISLLLTALPFSIAANDTGVSSGSLLSKNGEKGCNVIVNVGKDETTYNLTWESYDQGVEMVQWVKAESFNGAEFPSECFSSNATKVGSTCRAQMTGLESDTDYLYRVGCDSCGWSEVYSLSTGNFGDKKFSFIVAGDPQINTDFDSHNWGTTLSNARKWFGDDIEFLLTVGDQVNLCNVKSMYEGFANPDELRSMPLMSVLGNHDDNSSLYSAYFTYTDVDQASVTNAGPYSGNYWVAHDGVLFVTLNMNKEEYDVHIPYLEKAIKEYAELYGDPVWTILAFHQSFYSGSSYSRDVPKSLRERCVERFSELGVDVVFAGHDHIYTRSYMINGGEVIDDPELYTQVGQDLYGSYMSDGNGDICYITAGPGAGYAYDEPSSKKLADVACCKQEYTPTIIKTDVTNDSLIITTYRSSAKSDITDVVDFFAIRRDTDTDTEAPVITAPAKTYYHADEDVDLLYGVSAYDAVEGDLTAAVTVAGTVDPAKESVITYTVTDSAGNTAVKECRFIPVTVNGTLGEDAIWSYLDDASLNEDQINNGYLWAQDDFDTSLWKQSVGPFGSLNGELGNHNGILPNTLLNQYYPEGSDEEGANIPNFFFRTEFDVNDPEKVDRIVFEMTVDDAVSIFVNGKELFTVNKLLAEGDYFGYSGNERTTRDCEFGTFLRLVVDDPKVIAALDLKEKGNLLAIELYQGSYDSEDILFALDGISVEHLPTGLPFTDVKETSWYYLNVSRAYAKGLFAGTAEGVFSPKGEMTRAMTWTVLARIAKAELKAGEKWYSPAREWAMASGVSDGTNPHGNITRQELALMLYSLNGRPETAGTLDRFSDADTVSAWALEGLRWAVEVGLMEGRGEGILAPKAFVTRAEACTMLLNYLGLE